MPTPSALLIDTDVLIDYLRGEPKALAYLKSAAAPLRVSCLTLAELYVGVRDGAEREALARLEELLEPVAVDRDIAVQAGLFRREYGRSHGTGLIDAAIAASTVASQSALVTLNARHFPMLREVIVPYRKP
ncbi:MAG TPA: type II toxin-antitoxin system VapC family toxin [Candidatus Binataceae bacterium]|nr:type II toxin-antitoxin system VapC family toxin [Candidatus Binataceae bacterium]